MPRLSALSLTSSETTVNVEGREWHIGVMSEKSLS